MANLASTAVPFNPITQDYSQAAAHIAALTGQDPATAIIDTRMIHDADKARPAIPMRGTLAELWASIVAWQSQGFGAFINANDMDGNGRELTNVRAIRAHAVDLDNLSSQQNYERAAQFNPPPSFAVQSSPDRYHVYWTVQPYVGNERGTSINRRLRTLFDGDKAVVDPSRVLRLAGTINGKYSDPASDKYNGSSPHLVTCWALGGYGKRHDPAMLEIALASVNVIEGGHGGRHDLGEPSLAAPSLDQVRRAMALLDPNDLDRSEWIATLAALKQAAWTHGTPHEIDAMLMAWCARYKDDNPGDDRKQIASIRNTELGWPSLLRRIPALHAELLFGGQQHQLPQQQPGASVTPQQQISDNAFGRLVAMGTHADMAEAFALKNAGRYLYNASRGRWLCWNGTQWADMLPEAMLGNVREFCTVLSNADTKRPRTLSFWQSVLTTMATMPVFLRKQEIFDNDGYLLNTPSGTIDLRTGQTKPHDPNDHITVTTKASPVAGNGRWTTFIDEITCGDRETAKTLQTMFGAALSGAIEEHWIAFLWGGGRNGKSALTEAIANAVGDYARRVPGELFVSTKHDQHPTGLTTLVGSRFAYASEIKEGAFFDVNTLKAVSGDETIKARYMRGDFFDFRRTFKLFLVGNDLPQIRAQDVAIKSRLIIVPFKANFSGREDKELPAKLRDEAGMILQWLLDGHAMWIEAGKRFTASGAIAHATSAYFAAQSTPEMWFAERASIVTPDTRPLVAVPTAAMTYGNYAAWKQARGETPISQTKFGTWIAMQQGIGKVTGNGVRYRGIDLLGAQLDVSAMPGQVIKFPVSGP